MMDFTGKYKWTAWDKRKGMSQDDAKKEYVEAFIAVRIQNGFFASYYIPRLTSSTTRLRSSSATRPTRPRRSFSGLTVRPRKQASCS